MKHTTFVLGAGASNEYGFPVGSALIDDILGRLTTYLGSIEGEKIINRIRECAVKSIDEYLIHHSYDSQHIKHLIGDTILDLEQQSIPKLVATPSTNLYVFLLDLLQSYGWENFSFISFNYDRSLEAFLFRVLKQRNPSLSAQGVFDIIYRSKFRHVFGRMPLLPDEPSDKGSSAGTHVWLYGQSTRGPSDKQTFHRHFAANFRTIHEAETPNLHNDSIKIISNSNRVVFLGCAYHEPNIKVLGYDFASNDNQIELVGTAWDLGPHLERRAKALLKGIRLEKMKCLDLLKSISF